MYGLRIKEKTTKDWQEAIRLADLKKGIQDRVFTIDSKLRVPQGTKRLLASTFYQLKLGHGYIKAYLKRFRKATDDRCSCGAKETTHHILFDCPLYADDRKGLYQDLKINRPTRPYFLDTRIGIEKTLSFLQTTGVATRRWHLERLERELGDDEGGDDEGGDDEGGYDEGGDDVGGDDEGGIEEGEQSG
jgi:hypothetical protein